MPSAGRAAHAAATLGPLGALTSRCWGAVLHWRKAAMLRLFPPPPPPPPPTGHPLLTFVMALASLALLKRGIEYTIKKVIETIDQRFLGIDITIGSVRLVPQFNPVVSMVLRDVHLKNPYGFEDPDMAIVEEVKVDFALVELLWTWISPRRKVFDIKGVRLSNVYVLYETRSPELGLKNSNFYQVIEHIRFMSKNRRLKAPPKKIAKQVAAEPTFHLRLLRTEGFFAALSVDGVDLPLEKTKVQIKDLYFPDFMDHIRTGVRTVKEIREDGAAAGISEIAGMIMDEVNEKVMEQLKVQMANSTTGAFGDTLASTASALKELDADGDGNVSPEEIAAAMWSKLPF